MPSIEARGHCSRQQNVVPHWETTNVDLKSEVRSPKSEVQTKLDKTTRRIGSAHREVRDLFHGCRKVAFNISER